MSTPHPYALSKFYTSLLGKDVTFALAGAPNSVKTACMLGEYRVEPEGGACVVSADLSMLAHCAAALLGLPGETAVERATETPMDEPVRDAMHEVLNVTAAGIATTHRLVFTGMHREAVYLSSSASDVLSAPLHTSRFDVKLDGGKIGQFTIYSN